MNKKIIVSYSESWLDRIEEVSGKAVLDLESGKITDISYSGEFTPDDIDNTDELESKSIFVGVNTSMIPVMAYDLTKNSKGEDTLIQKDLTDIVNWVDQYPDAFEIAESPDEKIERLSKEATIEKVLEKYASFASFASREQYVKELAEGGILDTEVLDSLMNDEPDENMAEYLRAYREELEQNALTQTGLPGSLFDSNREGFSPYEMDKRAASEGALYKQLSFVGVNADEVFSTYYFDKDDKQVFQYSQDLLNFHGYRGEVINRRTIGERSLMSDPVPIVTKNNEISCRMAIIMSNEDDQVFNTTLNLNSGEFLEKEKIKGLMKNGDSAILYVTHPIDRKTLPFDISLTKEGGLNTKSLIDAQKAVSFSLSENKLTSIESILIDKDAAHLVVNQNNGDKSKETNKGSNMEKVKYRTIQDSDSITILLEDGGIADIREVEELNEGDGRKATTEYYQSRFTAEDLNSEEDVWTAVGEGKMYYNDWKTPFTDPAHLQDALNWLSIESEFEVDESIWPQFEESQGITKTIPSKLSENPSTEEETPSPAAP